MKFGNENFSREVFTEDTVANAIKNLPIGKASIQMIFRFPLRKILSMLTAQN